MKKDTINILYAINSNKWYRSFASIQSVLENNRKSFVKIYLMIDNKFNPDNKVIFDSFRKFKNCADIIWVSIDESEFANLGEFLPSEASSMYFLAAGKYINEERILYLDSYDIATADLFSMYNMDLEGHSCAAPEYIHPQRMRDAYGFNNDIIFNINTILIDLNKWKEKRIYERFINFDCSIFQYNKSSRRICFFNKLVDDCLLLDFTYCYTETSKFWLNNVKLTCSKNTLSKYNLFRKHLAMPKIIFFTYPSPLDKKKRCQNSYTKIWWKYARKTAVIDRIKYYIPQNFVEKVKRLCTVKGRVAIQKQIQNSAFYKKYSFIMKFVKPYWLGAVIAFGLAIPIGCLDAVIALSLKPYMDVVMIEKNTQSPWFIPILIVAFTSLQGILNFAATYSNDWITGKVSTSVKKALYDKLMHMGTYYIDQQTSGDIQKRFNNDADKVCTGIFGGVKLIISRVFSSLSLVGVLIYNSWQLAIIAIVVLICSIIPLTKMKNRIRSVTNQSENAMSVVITDYNEMFSGNKIVKAFNLYNLKNKLFNHHLDTIFNLRMQISKKTGIISPIMHIIISIGIGLTIGYGSYLITSGQITSGNFVSFITALIMLYTPIKGLGGNMKSIQMSMFALERVIKQLNANNYIIESPSAKEFTSFNDSIEFKDVDFQYVSNRPVLKNINFTVEKGETFALVGNSGGGKTTIVNLLPRFYKVKKGSIMIDGIDISDYKIDSLRDNISIVLQDNFLFAGTIRDNIMMGKLDATEDELNNAVKNACLSDFIANLDLGLDTYIGEKGVLLSGGQKQRIAIARAFIKNAPIVILDEATSALDNQSEAIVQEAIDNLMKDKTVFVIAHRLSTIQNADRIAVINNGELVELGRHEELMQIENGEYRKLYEMQFKTNREVVPV